MAVSLDFRGFDSLGVEGTVQALERLDQTTYLAFRDCDEGIDVVLQRLVSSVEDGGWLCPRLSDLILQGCQHSEAAVMPLIRIVSDPTTASDSSSARRPTTIRYLLISGNDVKTKMYTPTQETRHNARPVRQRVQVRGYPGAK